MAGKRRLTDLYITGVPLTFDDGAGDEADPIDVFVRKLNPVDHETALRVANAARSKLLAVKKDPEDPEYLAQWAQVTEFAREGLIEYLVEDDRLNRLPAIEAELAAGDEWVEDAYLEGLRDAWDGGLNEAYAVDPEDPEAARVFKEMGRFADLVDVEIKAHIEDFRDDLEKKPTEALEVIVFDKFLHMRASLAWLGEYRRAEIWLATREADRKTPYFESRDEVDQLPEEVLVRLTEAYRNLSVDPTEGKGLRVTEASSPSSEPPASPALEEPSGREVVTA